MTKPKGVWLHPAELGELAEATVVKDGPQQHTMPPALKQPKHIVARPLLAVGLAVCCCILAGLVSLHVYAEAFSLPLPGLKAAVSADTPPPAYDDVPEPQDTVRFLAYGQEFIPEETETMVEINHGQPEYISAEALDEVLSSEQAEQADEPPTTVPGREMDNPPVIASRSGDSAEAGEITTADGETFKYTRKLSMESTAYTWTNNKTATGTWPRVPAAGEPGTIAVDPRVIPLGSRVYVENYGFAIAEDTGGAINGNIIDVYLDTRDECILWGRKRGITVYILE